MGSAAEVRAGSVDGQADVDVFHANSINVGAGAGAPALVTAQELGLHLRFGLNELDDALRVRLHYDGREPLPGDIANSPLRALYEASVSFEIWEDTVDTKIGRFLVPGPVFLPVDGGQVKLQLPFGFTADAFGGRRGMSTSRRNLGIDKWLPAFGGTVGWAHELARLSLHVSYAEDEALFLKSTSETSNVYGGFNVFASGYTRPFDSVLLGAHLSLIQQGGYVIGPTWSAVDVEAQFINLVSGVLWGEYRPFKWLRAAYDFQYQRPSVIRTGTVAGEDAEVDPEIVDPNFIDNRLKLSWAPFDIGWVRGGVRHRLRPERQEIRYLAEIDVDRLIPFGFYTRGQAIYEQILHNAGVVDPKPLDRILGSLSVGYYGYGFDASTGLSYIERSGLPLSSRQAGADASEDLSPFVLEAQRLFFLRASYGNRFWHAGVDLERNIDDNEYRVLAQVGGRAELSW
jgi:hypothetical protein